MFTEKPSKHSFVNLLIKKKMFLTKKKVSVPRCPLSLQKFHLLSTSGINVWHICCDQ